MQQAEQELPGSGGGGVLAPAGSVLLRSSWQTVNIGDIAHTFGALQALRDGAPGLRLSLWPCCIDCGVRERLLEEFPELTIVEGGIGADGRPDTAELRSAFAECDLLLHGSGPAPVRAADCAVWEGLTGKPYGFFGITVDPGCCGGAPQWEGGTLREIGGKLRSLGSQHLTEPLRGIMARAAFVFCRETLTRDYLLGQGLGEGERIVFGPDAVFALAAATPGWRQPPALLQQLGLEEGGFLCVVPRLRWTPYHRMNGSTATSADLAREAVSLRTAGRDHEVLRSLMVRWVRETGRRVLVCPEMTYQVELGREQLVDPLPAEVRRSVTWLDRYWLCDEAAAVYARAAMVVSLENHSPILALGQGTPVAYVRQPTDTIKGQMWHDLGLSETIFEVGEASLEGLWSLVSRVLSGDRRVLENYRHAREMAKQHLASMARVVEDAGCLATRAALVESARSEERIPVA